MYAATQILRKEHDAILKMIEACEKTAQQLERGDPIRAEVLGNLQEFFQLFADRCHHGKEEDLLFPLLEAKGLPRIGGPVGVMLMEHDEGRRLVRAMGEAAKAYAGGDQSVRKQWADAAQQYAMLLRQHIMKENEVLFVMAERLLSEEEQRRLAQAFEMMEAEKIGAGTHERLHKMMDKLLAEVLVSKAAQ
jgi:hemerythrin-like domain-containing protein